MPDTTPLILLVDDDDDFLAINRHLLEPAGYRVRCASGPDEAWNRIAEERPDLIITDLMMSNLDSGFSFAKRIKQDERCAAVPVIIITGVSSQAGFDFRPRSPADLAAMGADAFLEKPVQPKALLSRVAELLGTR